MVKATDPRTIRTRQLIIDAFNELLVTKGFEQMTVKDITERATINRATFYAHFVDKYALLEEVLTELIERIMTTCLAEVSIEEISERVIVQYFLGIVRVHDQMYANCRRGYNAFTHTIDEKLKQYLVQAIEKRLPTERRANAVIIGWGLYGMYSDWDNHKGGDAAAYAKKAAQPLLLLI